jgi:hypothetical protein
MSFLIRSGSDFDTPEENAWPVVAEEKDAAKWGARSAGCAAGSDIARNKAARRLGRCCPNPAFRSESRLALIDFAAEVRAIRVNRVVRSFAKLPWRRFRCEPRAGMFALGFGTKRSL